VFKPQLGKVESSSTDEMACWFIDTDYSEESFVVPPRLLLRTERPLRCAQDDVKTEINAEAWTPLHSDTSRPFPKPQSGRIAVKVINHVGDEVTKVFKV
jgi:adenine-specific DNA-methyltransferase